MSSILRAVVATVATTVTLGPTAALATVDPATYSDALDPGASVTITKTVSTPEIPPRPDIVLLVDRTGSMGGAIGNVKANMSSLVTAVEAAQPDAQWAVASYCDEGEPDPFLLHSDLSAETAVTVGAVGAISLCNGGDEPESQLNALWETGAGGDAVTFREGSSRIVVWFGDAPGHDPSLGRTEADATASLVDVQARVLAVGVDTGGSGLDATGQASRITGATGGAFYSGVGAEELAATILAGLSALPVEVGATAACDPGLTATLEPAVRTVTSGTDAVFEETLALAADAPQGATLTCELAFTLNGEPGGEGFTQLVSIDVNDVTPPVVSCVQGPNPAGRMPGSGDPDGFFELLATDNVDEQSDVTITDTVSGTAFGPYPSGTTIKLVQAPGAVPTVSAHTGAVDLRVRLQGDALLTATDTAGNTATAVCEVPPHG